jgi:hypothetical protein
MSIVVCSMSLARGILQSARNCTRAYLLRMKKYEMTEKTAMTRKMIAPDQSDVSRAVDTTYTFE